MPTTSCAPPTSCTCTGTAALQKAAEEDSDDDDAMSESEDEEEPAQLHIRKVGGGGGQSAWTYMQAPIQAGMLQVADTPSSAPLLWPACSAHLPALTLRAFCAGGAHGRDQPGARLPAAAADCGDLGGDGASAGARG